MPLIKPNGDVISKPEDIAEALEEQYESVYSTPKDDKMAKGAKDFFRTDENSKITELLVTYEDIKMP